MRAYKEDKSITDRLYKNIRSNNRLSAFLVCLLIATICWIFTALNKSYTGHFTFSLKYHHIPFQKNVTSRLPDKLEVEMEARGFDLMVYSFRQKLEDVYLDINSLTSGAGDSASTVTIQSKNVITAEVTGMQPGMSIKKITPETITFDFSRKYRKKIPVIAKVNAKYRKQYYAPFHWIVRPDSVEIAGSREAIDKIHAVATGAMEVNEIDRKLILPAPLQSPGEGVEISPARVWVYIPAEELAEEQVQVPVEVTDISRTSALLLPDRVTVTFQTALKNIERINTEEFRVCAESGDFSQGEEVKLSFCHIPAGVYNARITPGFTRILTAR